MPDPGNAWLLFGMANRMYLWAYLVDCASLRFGSLMIGRSVAVLGMACGRTEGAPTLAFGPAVVRRPSCALTRNNNDGFAL